jgi:hypothetical protein
VGKSVKGFPDWEVAVDRSPNETVKGVMRDIVYSLGA